jgi:hypothetical protein
MKFIAILRNPEDIKDIQVGLSNQDITAACVTSVAREGFGIFSIASDGSSPTANEYRLAAAKLLKLATIRETIENVK